MKANDLLIVKEIINTGKNWQPEQRQEALDQINSILKTDNELKEKQEALNEEIKALKTNILDIGSKSNNLPLDFNAKAMEQLKPAESEPGLRLVETDLQKNDIIKEIAEIQGIKESSKSYKLLYKDLIVRSHSDLNALLNELSEGRKEERKLDNGISQRKFKSPSFRRNAVKNKLILQFNDLRKSIPEYLQENYNQTEGELDGMELPLLSDLVEEMKRKVGIKEKVKC